MIINSLYQLQARQKKLWNIYLLQNNTKNKGAGNNKPTPYHKEKEIKYYEEINQLQIIQVAQGY